MFSVGSVEGVPFTACTSGPNIIILASNFSRVQQITASLPITSLDCSTDVGKICAAYNNKMVIFEPIPLVQQQQASTGVSKLDYKWVQTASIESDTSISVMSFNLEGNRLVAGGQVIQLWCLEGATKNNWLCVWSTRTSNNINYLKFSPDGTLFCSASKSDRMVKIWYESVTSVPSLSASNSNMFSEQNPSGTTLSTPNCLSPPPAFNSAAPTFTIPTSNQTIHWTQNELNSNSNLFKSKLEFSFIYIAHPQPITGFEWRRTSKYTPRGAVANMLITSCKDNIARVWVQTLLPDDGLVNFNQLKNISEDLVNGAPRIQTQRHRQKLLRRLKRMKAFSQFKKRHALALDHSIDELEKVANSTVLSTQSAAAASNNSSHNPNIDVNASTTTSNSINNNPNGSAVHHNPLPTALSAHDFHSYAMCSSVVKPGLHFHLAGIIEADIGNDSQSVSLSKRGGLHRSDTAVRMEQVCDEEDGATQFVVHWINNKEIHITRSIELLLHDMLIRILRGNNPTASSTNSPHSAGESCSGSENDTDDLDETIDDTITAESSKKLRHKLCRKVNKQRALAASGRRDLGDSDDNSSQGKNLVSNGRASPTSLVEEFDKTLELLLKKWQMSADLLFSVNKIDGSLTLWQVKYLDGEDTGVFRQVQIDLLTRLRSALPHYDAITMSLNVTAYSPSAYLDVKRAFLAVANSSNLGQDNGTSTYAGDQISQVDVPEILSINTDSATSFAHSMKPGSSSVGETKDSISACSITDAEPSIFIVTQHLSGILGLWKLNFDVHYPKVQSVDLVTRITGLPIDPSWLRDGILTVEYQDAESILLTKWSADESGRKSLLSRTSSRPTQSPSHFYNFEEVKSYLLCHLPSVEEESIARESQCYNPDEPQTDLKDSYRASQIATSTNILPQYHLRQLIELLAFSKLQRVKAILNHLVNCLVQYDTHHDVDQDSSNPEPWAQRSRTLSIFAPSEPTLHDSFDIENPSSTVQREVREEIELDYVEVTSIRPLPLYSLLDADTEKPNKGDSKTTAQEEFSTSFESIMKSRSQVDETLDEILGQSAINTLNKQKELMRLASDTAGSALTSFNRKKAKLLTQVLTHTHLPGLSNIDQMHLSAVADAVALFDASPDDLHNDDNYETSQGDMISTNIAIDSLDDRGLRFLTAMRQHVYLTRCLPMKQRNELRASGIGNHNLVWAFHSESQDELISLIPCVQRNKPEWAELREYGIGWWLKKLEVLRKLIEKVAQSAYQARQDPLDAALFYLAMKKKTLVCALLRRVNCDKRLLKLFEQDFNDPVNRKKALKNAYALLGLHRFEHAAAFFILAGSIWDAVEVCINNLNDIQLAMVLIRLHDSDSNIPSNLRKLLFTEILGSKRPTELPSSTTNQSISSASASFGFGATAQPVFNFVGQKEPYERKNSIAGVQYNYDPKRAHQDPFLRSMAFWKLCDYLSAVHTLLESDVGQLRYRTQLSQTGGFNSQGSASRKNSDSTRIVSTGDGSSSSATTATAPGAPQMTTGAIGAQLSLTGRLKQDGGISASVFNFYLFLKDQPLVIKHKQQLMEEAEIRKRTSPVDEERVHCHRARSLSSGELGFDASEISRAVKQSSTEFEVLNDTTRLVDKYSDEAIADKERRLFFSTAQSYLEAGCPLLAIEVLSNGDHLNVSKSARMKFIACLHVLMNELNTLAASSQASAGCIDAKFRNQFFEWLQRSVDAMRRICSYAGSSSVSTANQDASGSSAYKDCERQSKSDSIANIGRSARLIRFSDPSPQSREDSLGRHGNDVVASDDGDDDDYDDGDKDHDDGLVDELTWTKANEPILRAMLTYCNLHSAAENSLTTVRLELLGLLKMLSSQASSMSK